jgi:hypothetical protein
MSIRIAARALEHELRGFAGSLSQAKGKHSRRRRKPGEPP